MDNSSNMSGVLAFIPVNQRTKTVLENVVVN